MWIKICESNFWKSSERFVKPEIFCWQPFKNEWKLVVLLLFSKFSASFYTFGSSQVLLLFSNFLRCFSRIWRISENFQKFFIFFSEIYQKFLKKYEISEKLWIQRFSTASHSKMDGKLVVLLLFSNCSASFSLLLAVPRYQKWRKTSCFLRLFSNFLRSFSRIVTNFRFFQKFLKKNLKNWNFLKKMWLQRFSAATHSKMDENWLFCCCFQNVQLVFHYFLAVPRYQKLRKTSCFAAIFKLFALLFSNFDEFQTIFRHFSIKKKTEKI